MFMPENDLLLLTKATEPLLWWYRKNARVLPWREDVTPYRVWVSEIMLQQTRVSAVMPYFERWMNQLPTVQSLAEAEEETLLKLWEGLGYYNRVRNLQKAAKIILTAYGGEMPSDCAELLKLPGIGEYTAGAIGSIAFGQNEVAVDGNVLRVISRLIGSYRDINDAKTKKEIQQLLREVLPNGEAGTFNQALMELGATVCLPNGMPLCSHCPWVEFCRAHETDSEQILPVKTPKKQRKIEQKTVFLLCCQNRAAVRKRAEKGLLAGMWEVPSVSGFLQRRQVVRQLKKWGLEATDCVKITDAKHVFTHIEWHMQGYLIEVAEVSEQFVWCDRKELQEKYALPSAFKKYVSILQQRLNEYEISLQKNVEKY